MSKQATSNPPSQLQRFKEAARDLGTDESEAAFDRALRTVGKAPPAPMRKEIKPRKKRTK